MITLRTCWRWNQVLVPAAMLCLWIMAIPTASCQTQEPPLRKVADIPLPGKAVRFDYQSLDTLNGRLYIAHMNADQLVVFDTRKRKVVANLDGVPACQPRQRIH